MKHKNKYDMTDVLRPIRKERRSGAIRQARKGFELIAYAGVYLGFIAGGVFTIYNLI